MNDCKSGACEAKSSETNSMNDLRLAAARKRLAESTGQEDAIDGVREIAANFLGSEEIGLFRLDRRPATFQPLWSCGIDLESYDLLRTLGDAGLQRILRGECHVELAARGRSGAAAKPQAFIPIRAANQTVAVLALLRLLPQKLAFDRSDLDLFQLLSDEAAQPLFGPIEHPKSVTDGPGMSA
jgi:hypothetical protein